MYLLYLDESGTQTSARHLVLAGVALHENRIYWAKDQIDDIQRQFFPNITDPIQFHATSLRVKDVNNPPHPFNLVDDKARSDILNQLYQIADEMYATFFAVVVEKGALPETQDPYEYALEQMLSRFEQFIRRRYRETDMRNKGLVVIAASQYRERLETLARHLASEGTTWVELDNLVDIPFFTLSRNSRLLQIADLIANTVYGRYESSHAREFDRMLPKFDQDDSGRIHGLVHFCSDRNLCYLPCCLSRRASSS